MSTSFYLLENNYTFSEQPLSYFCSNKVVSFWCMKKMELHITKSKERIIQIQLHLLDAIVVV